MSDLVLNIADWWNSLAVRERAAWLSDHRADKCKVSWALYTWRCLRDKERMRIESALWKSGQLQAA